jgi:hypothetical protein
MKRFLQVSIIILLLLAAFCLCIFLFASNLKYSEEIVINKNIDTVIVLFDNPYIMKEYMYGMESYTLIEGNLRKVGAKARIEMAMIEKDVVKRRITMTEEVITKNLPHKMQVTYTSGIVFNIATNKFEKISDNKTRFITEQEFQFKGFMKIISFFMPSIFKQQTKIYLESFKHFVENQD